MADSADKNDEGAKTEVEQESSRKRKEISSISDLDTSGATLPSPDAGFIQETEKKEKERRRSTKDKERTSQCCNNRCQAHSRHQ